MSKNSTPAKMPGGKRKIDFKMLGRVIKLLFRFYPRLLPIAMLCMVLSAMVSACPAIFTQRIINIVDVGLKAGSTWDVIAKEVVPLVLLLLGLYVLSPAAPIRLIIAFPLDLSGFTVTSGISATAGER